MYFICSFLVIVANGVETAFIVLNVSGVDKDLVDFVCSILFAVLFFLMHIILIIVIYYKVGLLANL